MCIAVLDVGGNLKAFSRMDGAPLPSSQVGQDMEVAEAGLAALG